jgi:hypothetical protein
MSFGMMQAKWGILQRPLGCSINNMLWLVQVIARLHKYYINERLADTLTPFDVPDASVPHYIPSVPHNANDDPIRLNDHAFQGTTMKGTLSFASGWLQECRQKAIEASCQQQEVH